jgi:hypothetical protein
MALGLLHCFLPTTLALLSSNPTHSLHWNLAGDTYFTTSHNCLLHVYVSAYTLPLQRTPSRFFWSIPPLNSCLSLLHDSNLFTIRHVSLSAITCMLVIHIPHWNKSSMRTETLCCSLLDRVYSYNHFLSWWIGFSTGAQESVEGATNSLDRRHVGCRHRADLLGLLQCMLLVEGLLFFLFILDTKQRWPCLGSPCRRTASFGFPQEEF